MLVFHLIRTAVMPVFVRVNLFGGEGGVKGQTRIFCFASWTIKLKYQINLIKKNIAIKDTKQKTFNLGFFWLLGL